MNKIRLAIVVSHPIQHFCPQYVSFAKHPNVQLKVFFGSALGKTPYMDTNFKQEIFWGNLNLEQFDHIFLNGNTALPVTKKLDASSLAKELNVFAPDVLITYGHFQRLQRRAYQWARKHNVLIGYISDSELRQRKSLFKSLLKYPVLKWYFSNIHFFFTVGDENERFYRKYGVPSEKLIRMHFPIDVLQYQECFNQKSKLNEAIRKKYNIGMGEIVLSVVGKLVAWKNQDHIIDALSMLEKRGINLVLFILGSGEKLEEWQQKAKILNKSKVHFTGFVNIETLPSYYAATDIYVHPASAEPHSIAISEAIYMGCPIIISSTCGSYGTDDDVQDGKNGFIYEFGNIEKLSLLIEQLASNEHTRKEFANYSHKIAVKYQEQAHKVVLDSLCDCFASV